MEETQVEVVEGTVEEMPEPSTDIVPVPEEHPGGTLTLFGTSDPNEVIQMAGKVATGLKDVLVKQRLTQRIGSSDHVKVEGWQTLGSMVGCFPVKEGEVEEIPWPSSIPTALQQAKQDGKCFGFRASYRVQTLSGAVVGGGEADCRRTESKWKDRDDYALKSMAQTRAQAKALKAPLGFIVTMAGYEATPAEEMDYSGGSSYGGKYGVGTPPEDAEKLIRAMSYLLDGQTGLVGQVRQLIEKDAGGYFPRIVSRALLHSARALRDSREPTASTGSPEEGYE
jgi:hypothetical protein